jgi:hypothetical protein
MQVYRLIPESLFLSLLARGMIFPNFEEESTEPINNGIHHLVQTETTIKVRNTFVPEWISFDDAFQFEIKQLSSQ